MITRSQSSVKLCPWQCQLWTFNRTVIAIIYIKGIFPPIQSGSLFGPIKQILKNFHGQKEYVNEIHEYISKSKMMRGKRKSPVFIRERQMKQTCSRLDPNTTRTYHLLRCNRMSHLHGQRSSYQSLYRLFITENTAMVGQRWAQKIGDGSTEIFTPVRQTRPSLTSTALCG